MEDYFGIKEVYDVTLRCPFPMVLNGRSYKENEPIIKFNKIQLAPLTESKSRAYASGGYGNAQLVNWEKTNEVSFMVSEGVISKTGFAVLSNSQLLQKEEGEIVKIPFSEELETNENGEVELKYIPNWVNIYNLDTLERIDNYELDEKILKLKTPYLQILIDYQFDYKDKAKILTVGKRLINGYLKLDGKMRLKDDSDGHIKTGIIEIPRIKLMSDLSMRLGSEAVPYVYNFHIVGLPVGDRGNQYVCKIIMLDNEIDSDL